MIEERQTDTDGPSRPDRDFDVTTKFCNPQTNETPTFQFFKTQKKNADKKKEKKWT